MNETSKKAPRVSYARTNRGYFDICVIFFAVFLIVANISATKLIDIHGFIFDGGAVTFPLTYILGDVISEVYGFKAAKRAIWLGFITCALGAIVFRIVGELPVGPGYQDQEAFMTVLGFVPRIIIASLIAYLVGEFLNSYVLVWIKDRFGEQRMWVRLVASTVVGEFFDSIIFCTIAFAGVVTLGELINYTIVGFVYKVSVEIVFLPITYLVINYVKRHEPSYAPIAPSAGIENTDENESVQ